MDEVFIIPVDEFNRFSNYYQNKITESALLVKGERLAAEQHLILEDKNIPDSMARSNRKTDGFAAGMLRETCTNGKKAAPSQYEGVEKPKEMADAPAERVLKEITRGVQQPQAIEIVDDSPVKKGRVRVFTCIVVALCEVRL